MRLFLLLLCLFTIFSAHAKQSLFNNQESGYELTLTIKNINGLTRSGAQVKLFNGSVSTSMGELTSNASGEVIFQNLMDGTYRYEVYYKGTTISPAGDNTEYWGSGEVTISGNSQSLVFTRNQPFISREAVFAPSVLQPNQSTSASFTIKNNQLLPVDTYIALWIDRDKSALWDLSKDIPFKTINAASSAVFPFSVTPALAGTYYCYAFVYTKVSGKFIITDQYTWYEVFKVNDQLGSLNVLLPDYNNSTQLMGYKISRYDLSYQLLDTKLTDNKGMANWTGIVGGNYLFERYNPFLNNLWENDLYQGGKQVNVIAGSIDTVTIENSEPFIESVTVNGTVFGPGSTVHAEVKVKNPSTIARTCKASIRIDLDQLAYYDFESGFINSKTIQAGQVAVFGFDWTIPEGIDQGTYSIAACIQTLYDNRWRFTDATSWNPLFKNENNTISQIQWSGMTWNVKSGTGLGPGPNDWLANTSSVWVDGEDNLHLRIRKIGTKWYCASISAKPLSGYGEYVFQVSSDVEKMDRNVVLGLFNYETDIREIDIEFSRWGDPSGPAGWYNVQPTTVSSHHSFDLNLQENYSTHKYQWSPTKVFFQSYHGHADYLPQNDKLITEWTYTGSQIPPVGNERVILNLWLFKGIPPSDMKETEVVIKSFSFSKVGNLTVHLKNLDQTSSPIPGANGIVQLYDQENKLISTKQSDSFGTVSFNGLRVGSGYFYRVFYQPTNPALPNEKDYWGSMAGVQIMEGQTTISIFHREQPIAGTIKAYIEEKEVTGQWVEPGIPIRIEQTIINPSSFDHLASGIIKLNRDSIESADFYLKDTSFVSIPAKSSVTHSWTIKPFKNGSYYCTASVQTIHDKDTINSDGNIRGSFPLFKIRPPAASFSMDITTGCAPLTVSFSDQSTFFPTSWKWDMNNDGKVDATAQHPGYTYLQAGVYPVKLTVANLAGSDSTVHTLSIVVNPTLLPEIKINATPSGKTDAGTMVTFNAISNNGGTYPTYEWLVDGVATGINNSIFSSNELTNGQKVSCKMSSNAPCAFPSTVTSNEITMDIKPLNKIPVANAGFDQTVDEGALVTLDGTASFDLDNQSLSYLWTAPKGIMLSSAASSQPTFTTPDVKNDTILLFFLKVNDGIINSSESSVKIQVIAKIPVNNIPVANAGLEQTVEEGTLVTLDGTASFDLDNQSLSYLWTAPEGVTLSSATSSRPTFTTPDIKNDTTLIFSLAVNDGIIYSSESFVKIHVIAKIPVNKKPVANAGVDQTVDEGALVTLDGTASFDLDNQSLTYRWFAPEGITLSSRTVTQPTFTAPGVKNDTTLYFFLTVNDGIINSLTSFVKIHVIAKVEIPVNKVPIANAGVDQTVEEGALVTLDGTASYDLDNQPISYLWTAPQGITLSSVTSFQPTFTAPEVKRDSTLTFSLVVNDGMTSSTASSVKIHVINIIPIATSGKQLGGLIIYPNPTKGMFYIEGLNGPAKTEISISTDDGNLVFKKMIHSSTCTIDLSKQAPGVYLLKINNQCVKIIRE